MAMAFEIVSSVLGEAVKHPSVGSVSSGRIWNSDGGMAMGPSFNHFVDCRAEAAGIPIHGPDLAGEGELIVVLSLIYDGSIARFVGYWFVQGLLRGRCSLDRCRVAKVIVGAIPRILSRF